MTVENSLEAFRQAATLGADGVELDIHPTADGRLVVHHDPSLPGLGEIAHLTADVTRRYRLPNGEPPPFLEEALAAIPDLSVWVEVKQLDPRWDRTLLQTLADGPNPRGYAVHSFDHRIIARLGRLEPGLRTGILSTSYPLDPAAEVRAAHADTLWQVWHLVDQAMVTAVHQAGAEVIAWTVNETLDARRLIGLGVDGLCGNYPERLQAALNP